VNQQDDDGDTPLHAAISNRQLQTAALLISHGADQRLANRNGILPLQGVDRRALMAYDKASGYKRCSDFNEDLTTETLV